jgi:hypothetical protein
MPIRFLFAFASDTLLCESMEFNKVENCFIANDYSNIWNANATHKKKIISYHNNISIIWQIQYKYNCRIWIERGNWDFLNNIVYFYKYFVQMTIIILNFYQACSRLRISYPRPGYNRCPHNRHPFVPAPIFWPNRNFIHLFAHILTKIFIILFAMKLLLADSYNKNICFTLHKLKSQFPSFK